MQALVDAYIRERAKAPSGTCCTSRHVTNIIHTHSWFFFFLNPIYIPRESGDKLRTPVHTHGRCFLDVSASWKAKVYIWCSECILSLTTSAELARRRAIAAMIVLTIVVSVPLTLALTLPGLINSINTNIHVGVGTRLVDIEYLLWVSASPRFS